MTDPVKMYYGAASGQQRAALRRLEPDAVMISHATQNNKPFGGEYDLFVDCGGYHHMMNGEAEYDTSNMEYVEYLLRHDPEKWALRDYPCEPDLLEKIGRSVREQQERTLEGHTGLWREVRDSELAESAVTVLQGWTVSDYLWHLEEAKSRGLPLSHVAIGSVCRRNQDREIAEIILAIRDNLPADSTLHAFGVKGSVLRFEEVCEALDSADSAAYDYAVSNYVDERTNPPTYDWKDCARAWLNWRHNLKQKMGTESLSDDRGTTQTNLANHE